MGLLLNFGVPGLQQKMGTGFSKATIIADLHYNGDISLQLLEYCVHFLSVLNESTTLGASCV